VSARLFPGIDRCAFKASVGRLIEIIVSSGVANEYSVGSTETETNRLPYRERRKRRARRIERERSRKEGREKQPRISFWIYREPNCVICMSPRTFVVS
jgi:hypothetical protein